MVSPVFAQGVAEQKNDRENNPLNDPWRRHHRLPMTVPPQHVSEVEERWLAGLAGVEDSKQSLKIPVQVASRYSLPAEFQQACPGVPPTVRYSGREDGAPPSRDDDFAITNLGSERSGHNASFLALAEMRMQGWAARSGRQQTVNGQSDFTLVVSNPADLENLSSMPVLQPQGIIRAVHLR